VFLPKTSRLGIRSVRTGYFFLRPFGRAADTAQTQLVSARTWRFFYFFFHVRTGTVWMEFYRARM
jgi:hypothetical protein